MTAKDFLTSDGGRVYEVHHKQETAADEDEDRETHTLQQQDERHTH